MNTLSLFLSFSLNHRPLPWMNEFSNYEVLFPTITPQKIAPVEAFFSRVATKKELGWLSKYPYDFLNYIYYIFEPYMAQRALKIKVAIVPIPNHRIVSELCDFLAMFSFVDSCFRDQSDPEVDLYISTFESLIPDNTSNFFLVDTNEISLESKNELFASIYKLYMERTS